MRKLPTQTIIDTLEEHAAVRGEHAAFRMLSGSGRPSNELTYAELLAETRRVAAALRDLGCRGKPVLLLYPSSTDFVSAFLGCLYAGAIAVPAYPPDPARLNRTLPRLQAIVRDCGATHVLTVESVRQAVPSLASLPQGLAQLEWIATDGLRVDQPGMQRPSINESVAFLQYTSGSTGDPKGVMVTHANLKHNTGLMNAAWPGGSEHRFVCWLPLYHDMGLIANVLQTVELGASCTLLSPIQFLRRPRVWLEAITRDRATISFAPNFAYDLCVRKVPAEELSGLSLDSWRVAINAAEPSRPRTMEAFEERFGPVGFRKDAFEAAYGLAESTVFATARGLARGPRSVSVCAQELARDRIVVDGGPEPNGDTGGAALFASNGRGWLDHEAWLVDPDTRRPTEVGKIGEIWLRGPSVASGYWKRPDATEETFHARLAGSGEGPFLRTGDLGFVHDGEFYVAGRLKDVIILNGANYYPHDLERSAQDAHSSVRPGCVVAFGTDDGSAERLVIVAEVKERREEVDGAAIAAAIRQAVFEDHDVSVDTIALVGRQAVPKTSSGKLQRAKTRNDLLSGTMDEFYRWDCPRLNRRKNASGGTEALQRVATGEVPMLSSEGIATFIWQWLYENCGVDRRGLEASTSFADLGLDSAAGVALAEELSQRIQRELNDAVVWQFPTVTALSDHLAGVAEDSRDSRDGLDDASVDELEMLLADELRVKG